MATPELTLGRQHVSTSDCIPAEDRLQQIAEVIESMGNPGPALPGDPIVVLVYYDGDTLVDVNGNVISPGGTTTIVVQWNDVAVNSATGTLNFEGTAVTGVVDDGAGKVTVTIDATAGAFSEGPGIEIDGGGEISVDLAAIDPCLEFDGSDDLRWLPDPVGGLERFADGARDKWRYHLVTGLAKGASYTPSAGIIDIDNITSIHGETPVASSADVLIARGLPLYCDDNDIIIAKYNDFAAVDDPFDSWTTDTMANLRPIMAGFTGYDPTKNMVLVHNANETVDSQQKMSWKERTNRVIWGLDPDGGHTITTSGTTLTLTLKVTKYTFDLVNLTSEVDADVTVTYEGTECP